MTSSFDQKQKPHRVFCLLAFLAVVLNLVLASGVIGQDEGEDKAAEAIALFQKGQDSHEKGQFAAAISLYEKAIELVPEFPEAELQRGNALISIGRIDDAEKAFRNAVKFRGEWTLALANLGSVLVRKGQYQEAEKILLKAITLDELNFPAYSALTDLRIKTKAKPEVLRELLSRIEVLTGKAKPTPSIWADRGALETALSDSKAAKISFDRALALDPNNQNAISGKAFALLNEGDAAGAESLVRKLESIAPGTANTIVLKARLLISMDRSEEAAKMLNALENPSPEVADFRDKMKISKSENIGELENQLEKKPEDPLVLGKLCGLYRTTDPAKALDLCRRASKADPENMTPAVGYAAALVQAKMFLDAIGLLRRLQSISPDNVTIRANLATAYFQLKRYPEAKLEYQWITEKQPELPAAHFFLAITHDHLLEYEDAMANYQQFLRIADAEKNKLEIEKVNLRLPSLQKQIKDKKGKRTK